ncbi:MAG: amidohydrolase family protein [Plesiomonas sp.]
MNKIYRRTLLCSALLLAVLPPAIAQENSVSQTAISNLPQKATLIENARIFTGTGTELTPPSNVLIIGNKISTISQNKIEKPANLEITDIDAQGKTLMPGLIDNHVHIALSASSQADLMNPQVSVEELQRRATQEAHDMLMRGFTAVRDMGGPMLKDQAAIDQGTLAGPRIYPSGGMISQTSGHGDFRLPQERARRFGGEVTRGELLGAGFIVDGRDEVLTATRENLRAGATQIKVMAGGGAATQYDPLDVAQYTLDEMKAAVEAAGDWGTYVTVHAYTPKSVKRAIDAGVLCIEHGQLLDEETIKLLGDKGIWLSLQALDEAPATAPENIREKKHQVVQGTDNAFTWALKHNVKLAWGTDFLFNPANNKKQNADIAKLKAWMTPAQVLKLVTHDNAQLLALSGLRNPYPGKQGVVEEGALADLLLVNGNPLENLELLSDPQNNFMLIMKDGKVYKNTLQNK